MYIIYFILALLCIKTALNKSGDPSYYDANLSNAEMEAFKAEIEPLHKEFYRQAKLHDVVLSNTIQYRPVFYKQPTEVIAQCFPFSDKYQVIQIDMIFWENATDKQRLWVILHELGHCKILRDHTDDEGVMSPFIINEHNFVRNYEKLIDELFDKTKFNQLESIQQQLGVNSSK